MNARSMLSSLRNLTLGLAVFGMTTAAAYAVPGATVVVDGRTLAATGLIDQGHTLVPLRGIFEALGASVKYTPGTRTIDAAREGSRVWLRLGDVHARVGGRTVALEVPARSMGGRTLVPLRFVAEALGTPVRWVSASRTVYVGGFVPTAPAASRFVPAQDLKRLAVGNQGGVLKVYDRAHRSVVHYRGLDDQRTAPVSPLDRVAIFEALGISGNVDEVSTLLIATYTSLPKKETLALLGVIGSAPAGEPLAPSAAARARILPFLTYVMRTDSDPANRRQALLAAAVNATIDAATVDRVVRHFEVTDNLWVTFPVQQFFAYHASTVKSLPNFVAVRTRLSTVSSLYTENVLASLR